MQKYLFLIGGIILSVSCATAPPPAPATSKEVAVLTTEAQAVKKTPKTLILRIPRLVKETSAFPDGTADEYRIFTYSQDGVLLVREESYDASSNDLMDLREYTYKDGLRTAETNYDKDKTVKGRREYLYDKQGRLVEERLLDKNDSLQGSSRYGYDAAGNKTDWTALDASGTVISAAKYLYEKGRLEEIRLLGPGGKTELTITPRYQKDLKTSETYLSPEGKIEKEIILTYDADERLLSETTVAGNKTPLEAVRYEYEGREKSPSRVIRLDGRDKPKRVLIQEWAYREEKKVVYE